MDHGEQERVLKRERMLPLYEAKMLHQFDHRWATYDGSTHSKGAPAARDVTSEEKADPSFAALPRYWVEESEVAARLGDRWDRKWLMGYRWITNTTNEHTAIAGVLPLVGAGNSLPLCRPQSVEVLSATVSSLALDYAARQKLGGSNMTFGTVNQLPTPHPESLLGEAPFAGQPWIDVIRPRALELTYTAWDVEPFARDLGDEGPPFIWDDERRFLLRAELDAAFFHLYGIARDDVDYIMDTFPIVRRKDEAAHGEYRTKRVILQMYDAMQTAADTGVPYASPIDPPPGRGPRHPSLSGSGQGGA